MNIWLIGNVIKDSSGHELGWMCEGAFTEEHDAVKNCKKDWFVFQVKLNTMFPEKAVDADCVYWPHLQTKEEGMARLKKQKEACNE